MRSGKRKVEYIRYENRKLYSKTTHSYVKLADILKMSVTKSVEVYVIDNKTKADITFETILKAIASQDIKKLDKEEADNLWIKVLSLGRAVLKDSVTAEIS